MNEVQIRERLRKAVGEARYPAYLTSRVEARINNPEPNQSPRAFPTNGPWLMGLGRTASLVAALLVVLFVASLVLGVHIWLINNRTVAPAGHVVPDPAIVQYQAMVQANVNADLRATGTGCGTFDDPDCSAKSAVFITRLQLWLDDLNRFQPPVRFSAADALMRRHVTRYISDVRAMIAASRAKDRNGFQAALGAARIESDRLDTEGSDIIASSQGTVATYTFEVRFDWANLPCNFCQRLLNQSQVSCQAGQTPSCVDEIDAVRFVVEAFQGDLVRIFAPDSLAAKDARLEADLSSASVELDAMSSALSTGDQVALQASYNALRQALGRVESDAADIVKGG